MTQVATPGIGKKRAPIPQTRDVEAELNNLFSQYAILEGIVSRRKASLKDELAEEEKAVKKLETEILALAGSLEAKTLFDERGKILLEDGEVVTKEATIVKEADGLDKAKLLKRYPAAAKTTWAIMVLKGLFNSADDRRRLIDFGIDLDTSSSLALVVNKK